MWTDATRGKYERGGLRYASDLTDGEWSLLAPLLASPSSLARPRRTDLREVMNAILYMARTGCQWRMPNGAIQSGKLDNRNVANDIEASDIVG